MTDLNTKKSTNVRYKIIAFALRAAAFVSPALAARVLQRLFLATRRFDVPQRESGWLEQLEPSTFMSRGQALAAWSDGDGPTVLLAHGWEGRGSQMGAFVRPLIAAGFRVVTFDAPGHGQSDARASSLVEMADAIKDAVAAYGPCHAIIAHSAGAAATTVAISRGVTVERTVFIAPPADLGGFLHKVSRWLGLPDEVAAITRRRLENQFETDWDTLRAERLAPAMRTPLLIIHDEDDREVRYENATRLVELWPKSELMTTTGLGHHRLLRDNAVVASAVAFVAAPETPTANRQASRVVVFSSAV